MKKTKNNLTPVKAIRQKCKECTGGSLKDIRNCLIADCPLFQFRMGNNPKRAGIGNLKVHLRKKTVS